MTGPARTAPTTPTVLIVDDEASLRRVLERALTARGYRVLSAATGETAYDLLATEQADALLLDVSLPMMSGLALYLAIVHRWPALDGRIAIMTGDPEGDEIAAWREQHRCTVIRKPFDLQEILNWVAATLRLGGRDLEAGNG